MATITQDMRFRLSLIEYAAKYGVTKAAQKYKTNRQYVYRWFNHYDGTWESLRDRSRHPHSHPNPTYQRRIETDFKYASEKSSCWLGRLLGEAKTKRLYSLYYRALKSSKKSSKACKSETI